MIKETKNSKSGDSYLSCLDDYRYSIKPQFYLSVQSNQSF